MSAKPNLSDLQLILLATAIQREDGSVFPLPDSIRDREEPTRKAIATLLRRQLISRAAVADRSKAWREEHQEPIGLIITAAGRTIIAAGEPDEQEPTNQSVSAATANSAAVTPPALSPRTGSKIETVIGLLRSEGGATLAALAEATGWLPHTTRAALTGLRKKGHVITRSKRDGSTVYQIAVVQA